MTTAKKTIPKLRTMSADSVRPSRRDPVTRSASSARTGRSTTARSAGSDLAVGVGGDDVVRAVLGCDPVAEPQGGALAAVHRRDDGVVAGLAHELGGAVLLAVDDDEERDRLTAELGRQRVEDAADVLALVVGGGDDDDPGELGVAVGGVELVERDGVDELVDRLTPADLAGVHRRAASREAVADAVT